MTASINLKESLGPFGFLMSCPLHMCLSGKESDDAMRNRLGLGKYDV